MVVCITAIEDVYISLNWISDASARRLWQQMRDPAIELCPERAAQASDMA